MCDSGTYEIDCIDNIEPYERKWSKQSIIMGISFEMIKIISKKRRIYVYMIVHIHLKARNRIEEYYTDATEEKHKKCFAVMKGDKTYQNIHGYSIHDIL